MTHHFDERLNINQQILYLFIYSISNPKEIYFPIINGNSGGNYLVNISTTSNG